MELIAFPRKSAANHEGPLTSPEKSWLRTLEDKIEKNLKGFYELGNALAKIRDNRLYRGEYRTFEQYCRVRWDFTRRHADHLIGSYKVIDNLNENSSSQKSLNETHGSRPPNENSSSQIIPINEAQARPLTRLSKPLQIEAWQKAVAAADGQVTAKHVKQAVAEIMDWEVRERVERIRADVEREPQVTLVFKEAYESLFNIIRYEQKSGWKNMSKAAALKHVQSLETIIRL